MNSQAEQFDTFVQFLAAVIGADGSERLDARLAAATGQNEAVGSAGGYLVPTEFAAQLWSKAYTQGRIMQRCDRQPITKGDRVTIPLIAERDRGDGEQPTASRFGGAQMYWLGEGDTDNDSAIDFETLTLKLKKLLGLIYTTDELLQDLPALVAVLRRLFGLEASFAIESAIVSGDGVARPLGVLKSGCLITVGPEAGQASGSLQYQNLAKMVGRLWAPTSGSAMWLMNNEVFATLLQMRDGDGAPIVKADGDVFRILTLPVEVCEYTSPIGQAGDIVLGDFSQYILAQKGEDADFLSSIHAKFANDETALKLRYRVDGAPGWAAPIKPKNSAVTVSPFVALGARP